MLNFKIEYHTRWGESLALVGADDKVWPMNYTSDGIWTLSVPSAKSDLLKDYFYVVNGLTITVRRRMQSRRSAMRGLTAPSPDAPFPASTRLQFSTNQDIAEQAQPSPFSPYAVKKVSGWVNSTISPVS